MADLIRSPVTLVWIILSFATGLSWWLGADHGDADATAIHTTVLLMLVAFFKVRLVIQHFMEVRGGPVALRLIADAWIILACGAVLWIYLMR